MSNKRTEYFDEIEVSEGQHFSVIFRKNNSERIKVFEITESGDCIVNKLIVKDCVVDSNSVKSEISRLSEELKNIDSEFEISSLTALKNYCYSMKAIENFSKYLNVPTEIIYPSSHIKMLCQDPEKLEKIIDDLTKK